MCFKKYLIPWNTVCSSSVYHSHQNCPYETGIRILPNQMHQCNQPCHNPKYLESTVYRHGQDKRGTIRTSNWQNLLSIIPPIWIQKTVLQITWLVANYKLLPLGSSCFWKMFTSTQNTEETKAVLLRATTVVPERFGPIQNHRKGGLNVV